MFLEKIRSEGLAHLSYMIGDGGEAAVIDPRRDCQVYLDMARRENVRITRIFETHRNEDFVVGSAALKQRTGATIYHGKSLDFTYGEALSEGDRFQLGDLELKAIETPGHTHESISLVVLDRGFGGLPVAVFTGDALFIGDVGRTDLLEGEAEAMAGLLHDSIFDKILPLGDQALVLPAHGAGSVCGSGMASREFSTIGYEKRLSPALQKTTRDGFVRRKLAEKHYRPPYFLRMEKYNLNGDAPDLSAVPQAKAMEPEAFAEAMQAGMQAIDIRSPEAFAGAFIPNALALPLNMIPAFAGWFLDYDRPIGIVPGEACRTVVEEAVRHLARIGFDKVEGYLAGGLHGWETSARCFERVPAVHVKDLTDRLSGGDDLTLLDVRKVEEFDAGHLPQARHIYLGELPSRLDEIPRDKPVVTFCGSGRRAIIAASILKQNGFEDVEDCLGSMDACSAYGCSIVGKEEDSA